jgi:thiol-disulfide isomerase/thioredoxin
VAIPPLPPLDGQDSAVLWQRFRSLLWHDAGMGFWLDVSRMAIQSQDLEALEPRFAKVFAAMKRSIGVGERIRKALGVAVLVGVVAIALGLDTGLLTRLSLSGTARFEQGLLDRFHQDDAMSSAAMGKGGQLVEEGRFPSLAGVTEWIGSPPLTPESLRGKVVLVDFWTYSCINCLRSLPYVRAWAEKYRDQGLVVIGVHTPEFAFEKDPANVRKAVGDLGIAYPVAIDNDHGVWRAFRNRYWPAHYFIDGKGRIRYHHFGEGDYAQS